MTRNEGFNMVVSRVSFAVVDSVCPYEPGAMTGTDRAVRIRSELAPVDDAGTMPDIAAP